MCGFIKGRNWCSCIMRKMTYHLHLFIHKIKVPLPVIIPQNQRNRQHHPQCSNMITITHQGSNPHWSSTPQCRIQFLANIQRLSSQQEAPYLNWDRYFQRMYSNMLQLLPFQDRLRPWTREYLEKLKYIPRQNCLIQILCIFTRQQRKMMLHSFKRQRTSNLCTC